MCSIKDGVAQVAEKSVYYFRGKKRLNIYLTSFHSSFLNPSNILIIMVDTKGIK